MIARYAKSYIDRLYDSKDIFALYDVISVICKNRDLPPQFSLFLRFWDWCCSTRSGIWQYYEAIPKDEFASMAADLERFGLSDLAERYRSGMATWDTPENCDGLDSWINRHWSDLESAAFQLIADNRNCLYDES